MWSESIRILDPYKALSQEFKKSNYSINQSCLQQKKDGHMTVDEWRNKHKRCKYCAFIQLTDCGWECTAKDKFVYRNIPRVFCKLFRVREDSSNENHL